MIKNTDVCIQTPKMYFNIYVKHFSTDKYEYYFKTILFLFYIKIQTYIPSI